MVISIIYDNTIQLKNYLKVTMQVYMNWYFDAYTLYPGENQ